jgi:ubiquinone/menaquinone biosynthesis C-methylase UbiE
MYKCNPVDYAAQIKANRDLGPDKFFGWFDGGQTVEEAFKKQEDIFNRIILPIAEKYVKTLDKKTSLDLGYGSGGQVVAASKHFKEAIGIDWHNEEEFVMHQAAEFSDGEMLFGGSPDRISLGDGEVDFIHSWLFFQRLGTMANVEHYLSECFRVLKDGGVACIFFPRYMRSKKKQTVAEYEADVKREMSDPIGFREGGPNTKIRGISIVIARHKFEELCEKVGFETLTWTASYDGKGRGKVYHGQHAIVVQKPAPKKVAPKKKTVKKSQLKQRK